MRIKMIYAICTLALLLAFALDASGEMQSSNYHIPASVLSSGGTSIDSTTYQMIATIGQSSATGKSSSSSDITYAGFWQPSAFKIRGKAMPYIPLLLLDE